MRCNLQTTVVACLLAAHSVQAGPLRWRRAFWERDEVNTPGEMPTLLPTTLTTITTPPNSTPSTTTIIDTTPLTTTIEVEPTTTPIVADDGSGTGNDIEDPNGASGPSFTTLTDDVPDALRDALTPTETSVEAPTSTIEFTLPPPNKTSLTLQPIVDPIPTPIPTPEPTTESTTLSSTSSTNSEDVVETPSGSSFLATTTTDEVIEPSSPSSLSPVEPSTTTIFPQDPVDTPIPGQPVPENGTPVIAPTEELPEEPTMTQSTSATITTSASVETPPADDPQFRTEQPPELPASPIKETTSTSTFSEEPTVPVEDSPAPEPTQEAPQSPEVPSTTTIEPEDPTSDVFTQTIGQPDVPKETTVEQEEPSTTESVEPTTTTTLSQSQTLTITESPTEDINPSIPTGLIQTTTMSVTPEQHQVNLDTAREINKIYDSLSPDMVCSAGQIACIRGKVANCAGGTFDIASCSEGQKCFALPSETINGVTVGCFNVDHAEAVLSGEKGPGSSTTTSNVVKPTSEVEPETPEQPTQPDVIEPSSSSASSVVAAEPTEVPPPPPVEPTTTTTNFFGTEPMFTAIVPITDDDDSRSPPASPTNAISDDKGPVPEAEDNASRTTQTINGTPTVSVTVTVTVATATVTEASVTTTVTEKETETVTVDNSGDRVDTVSVRN